MLLGRVLGLGRGSEGDAMLPTSEVGTEDRSVEGDDEDGFVPPATTYFGAKPHLVAGADGEVACCCCRGVVAAAEEGDPLGGDGEALRAFCEVEDFRCKAGGVPVFAELRRVRAAACEDGPGPGAAFVAAATIGEADEGVIAVGSVTVAWTGSVTFLASCAPSLTGAGKIADPASLPLSSDLLLRPCSTSRSLSPPPLLTTSLPNRSSNLARCTELALSKLRMTALISSPTTCGLGTACNPSSALLAFSRAKLPSDRSSGNRILSAPRSILRSSST